MIATRPAECRSEEADEGMFPEVPTHVPVLSPSPPAETVQSPLPPLPPVEIPVELPASRHSLQQSTPSVSPPSPSPSPAPSPVPDYSILYSQQQQQQGSPVSPVQQPTVSVIEAYPVLPEEPEYAYSAASSAGQAAVVHAQPYRASSTTTSTSTPTTVAPVARRPPRDDEETKEYNPGPQQTLTQSLRSFMHELGDAIMEVTDEMAARSSVRTTNVDDPGEGQIVRRTLMPHRVHQNATGRYDVYVTMHQPQLLGSWSTPQGARPRELLITTYSNEREAEVAGLAHAPPRWDGPNERNTCTMCNKLFTIMRRPHHCRNCGHYVCSSCSHKQWPSSMLPSTYHNSEKKVRTCNGCHFLMETFRDALKHGDYELARQTYDSGNVNLHCPNDLERGEYPVHFAAQGGNLMIMRWLVEEQMCALRDPLLPLLTSDKLSVLAVAAMYGQTAILHYLMHQHGCKVTEINSPIILQRALHIIVDAPGDPPPLPRNRISNRKRRGSTRRIATIGNTDFSN